MRFNMDQPEPSDNNLICPECEAVMEEDTHERTVDCTECDYGDGYDWEAAAEAKAESEYMDRMEEV